MYIGITMDFVLMTEFSGLGVTLTLLTILGLTYLWRGIDSD